MGLYWRQKRRAIFTIPIVLVILGVIFLIIYPYLNPAPTCFDGKLNGNEFGIDCGGSCQKVCNSKVLPLKVLTVRAIETETDLYDLVAMVQNDNQGREVNGSEFNIEFKVYDKAGALVQTLTATSSLPIGKTFPVIIQNVPLKLSQSGNSVSQVIANTSFSTTTWMDVPTDFSHSFFTVQAQQFDQVKNNISQLGITIKNLTKAQFRQIPILVTLKNKEGNFIAVNSTILPSIAPNGTANVYFTWRTPLSIPDPQITVYPIVTPNSDFR